MVRPEGNMSLKNPITPPGIDPETVRLVTQRLNHYAIQAPLHICSYTIMTLLTASPDKQFGANHSTRSYQLN
jgi:hypothetical protein